MAASTTKQVLAQKLRDQQRKMIQEEFADLEDPVLTARVIRFERQSVIMGVSSGIGRPEVEAELPKRDQLPNDNYRANATFKVFLKEVSEISRKGPQLFVSRANAGLVVYLFENEVPEIQEGTIKIVAVSREANPPSRAVGPRTKVAVDSVEQEVDPVGACIGARGARIQQVVNEIRGEKIEVIKWSSDPIQYILNSLSPAKVDLVRLVDPEGQHAHVLVPPDQLSLAIGREAQNVRLAARLTGWKIDVKNSHEYDQEAEDAAVSELIIQREDEENLQREAEQRLEAEQAERAAEDARLRELYPLPEDEQEYGAEEYQGEDFSDNDQLETIQEIDNLDLSIMQKHHLRILAHCLQILKIINLDNSLEYQNKNPLREWCDNQSKKFDDKKFSNLFYEQLESTSKKLSTFSKKIGKSIEDLEIDDLVLLVEQR